MPLSFSIGSTTNRSWGAGPASDLASLLTLERADFGSALQVIDVQLLHVGSVTNTNETMSKYSDFPARYAMPDSHFSPLYAQDDARFERKKQRLMIRWPSRRVSPDEAFMCRNKDMTIDLHNRCFAEVFDALDWALAVKLKKGDDFDPYAFMDWLTLQRSRSYVSDDDLRLQLEAARKSARAAYEALDPWAKLDIDWTKVSANVREILDDPRDWSQTDDFSPHGNDTGADIWASWSEYSRCSPERASAALGIRVPTGPDDDEHIWWHWVEVHLALAFGHIKKKGTCPEPLRQQTLEVIRAEKRRAATLADWKHCDDWMDRLTRYETILGKLA